MSNNNENLGMSTRDLHASPTAPL